MICFEFYHVLLKIKTGYRILFLLKSSVRLYIEFSTKSGYLPLTLLISILRCQRIYELEYASVSGKMKRESFVKLGIVLIIIAILSISFYLLNQPDSNEHDQNNINGDADVDNYFSSEMLLSASKMAGNYLINATSNEGVFAYIYDALHDSINISQYNILRHAGTTYSMLQLYDVTKDERLLNKSQKAIEILLNFEKPYDNASCIVFGDEMKLGGNALAVIALAEYTKVTGNDIFLSSMQNLTKYIEKSQMETGEFLCKRYYSTGEVSDFVSEYYPGEALLALCRLYSIDNNETWLDVAEKGAQYLILVRDGNISTYNLIHDHWLLMALNELYRYRNDSLYLNQSMRIAESIIHTQKDGVNIKVDNPNLIGSYASPRGTPTATRSEGIIAAYHLSNDFGNATEAKKILNSIKLGIKFQLQLQFTKENVVDLPNPQRSLGGFTDYFTTYDIRIDYVQHNLCSILGLYHILN